AMTQRAASRAEERRQIGDLLERSSGEESERRATFERCRERAEALRRSIDDREQEISGNRAGHDRAREQRSSCDLELADRRIHNDHLLSDIRTRYGIELADVALEEAEEAALEARFQELEQKVARMDRSTVGLEAMGELSEMTERREFLNAQKVDLERSVADLQKTIANLNRASRDRFAETFEQVNAKFHEVFPRLFRGGRARLALTDESDLLETGVDIQVTPPGMNLRSLSLLSGGQKALTAVSLIFSLFLCRPSPFCVLDEVDAPLDDANIDRFNEIVVEMSRDSQFLLITHNQRTMEFADRLYGVTMEEPGVSKVVAVRLQSAA
ncbi:MAG: chromosome segregation protein SMC, partial [Candidatus Binatia bacterium]